MLRASSVSLRIASRSAHSRQRSRVSVANDDLIRTRIRYRRLTAFGLWLVSASLVSGLLCQVVCIVEVGRPVQPKRLASADTGDLPDQPRVAVHLVHVLADVRGLGIAVQRRRCRDCRQVQCLCVVWRVAREGRRA